MSLLKEGVINKDGKDIFEEIVNNVGVNIDNSFLVVISGSIFVLGSGGSFLIEEIVNLEINIDIEKVSKVLYF